MTGYSSRVSIRMRKIFGPRAPIRKGCAETAENPGHAACSGRGHALVGLVIAASRRMQASATERTPRPLSPSFRGRGFFFV